MRSFNTAVQSKYEIWLTHDFTQTDTDLKIDGRTDRQA